MPTWRPPSDSRSASSGGSRAACARNGARRHRGGRGSSCGETKRSPWSPRARPARPPHLSPRTTRWPIPPNILTVDLEEWFHIDDRVIAPGEWDRLPSRVERTTRATLSLLEQCGARATFFALGWVAARHQALIREIRERGHEVATHGYMHRSIAEMSDEQFMTDQRPACHDVE